MWIDRSWCHEDCQGRACHSESVKILFSCNNICIYCFIFLMVFFFSMCTNFIWYVKCVNARLNFNVNYIMKQALLIHRCVTLHTLHTDGISNKISSPSNKSVTLPTA